MSTSDKWGLSILAVIALCLFLLANSIRSERVAVEENRNVPASNMRAQSICEKTNSKEVEISLGQRLGGRDGRISDPSYGIVRCASLSTGEVVIREFQIVKYREDRP